MKLKTLPCKNHNVTELTVNANIKALDKISDFTPTDNLIQLVLFNKNQQLQY